MCCVNNIQYGYASRHQFKACATRLQALFNFVIAWSLMLGPLMFADRKAANVPRKWPLYIGTLVSSVQVPQHALVTAQLASC
jgi:hypothetical protein